MALAELAWVLRARWERGTRLIAMERLLQTRGVRIETPALVQEAIAATRKGHGGFADHLAAQIGFAHGASEVITFDAAFSKTARVRRLK